MTKNNLVPFEHSWNSLFDSVFGKPTFAEDYSSKIGLNILERQGGYDVQLAVPGYGKEDISISIKDNMLTVSGESRKESDSDKYLHREVSFSKFSRSVSLPRNADKSKISAKQEDGILTVSIPTNEKVKETLKIDIS